jgi:drug/metabolite transporter (DMT)-like permease
MGRGFFSESILTHMKIKALLLYFLCLIIWGSTWYAITKQLGRVPVEFSVAYRFFSAGAITLLICKGLKINLKFKASEHFWFLLQGLFLYCLNYILTYLAEGQVSSGLVAVIFTLCVQFNILGLKFFYGQPLSLRGTLAAMLGILGVVCLFYRELFEIKAGPGVILGLQYGILGTASASLGNMITVRSRKNKQSVLAVNAWAMTYGGLLTALIALLLQRKIDFDLSTPYVLSLIYLSVFGSIVAFWSYNTLIGLVGAARASYVSITTPVIALIISTFFENFSWGWLSVLGVVLAATGNLIMTKAKS